MRLEKARKAKVLLEEARVLFAETGDYDSGIEGAIGEIYTEEIGGRSQNSSSSTARCMAERRLICFRPD